MLVFKVKLFLFLSIFGTTPLDLQPCVKLISSVFPVLTTSAPLPPSRSAPSVCLTEAFALVGGTVHKHLSRDDIAKGQEHL